MLEPFDQREVAKVDQVAKVQPFRVNQDQNGKQKVSWLGRKSAKITKSRETKAKKMYLPTLTEMGENYRTQMEIHTYFSESTIRKTMDLWLVGRRGGQGVPAATWRLPSCPLLSLAAANHRPELGAIHQPQSRNGTPNHGAHIYISQAKMRNACIRDTFHNHVLNTGCHTGGIYGSAPSATWIQPPMPECGMVKKVRAGFELLTCK